MIIDKRKSGVLMPIFSLPSEYGIGTLGKAAFSFIDNLTSGGQSYWQVLPHGPTGYGDSPYQAFSTFAGNPYFIDIELLIDKGVLEKSEADSMDFGTGDYIDYKALYDNRFTLLKLAFSRDEDRYSKAFDDFVQDNSFWLEDYASFMAIKDDQGGISWQEWPIDIKTREPNALKAQQNRLDENIRFYIYLQFLFYHQWDKLKAYANENNIELIGDIPIYVALDSADAWSEPQLFKLCENLMPIDVAGCPPDGFSQDGQLWGNPLYRWDEHKKQGYSWWIQRIKATFKLYDIVRIDHFRGFSEYYAIPFKEITAKNGVWKEGPGIELFHRFCEELGEVRIIAEDLGHITDNVRQLLADTKYPGMRVLQFAFAKGYNSEYLLHNHIVNSVVYTGTHDNQTSRGWFLSLSDEDKKFFCDYIGLCDNMWSKRAFLAHALSSVANLVIIPLQDYLNIDDKGRINTPSTLGGNWQWRLKSGDFSKEIIAEMKSLAQTFFRI